jgi:hypothetical protein
MGILPEKKAIAKPFAKDMLQGFLLPVLPDLVPHLAHAMVQPAEIAQQFSLQEDDGSRILKERLMIKITLSIWRFRVHLLTSVSTWTHALRQSVAGACHESSTLSSPFG